MTIMKVVYPTRAHAVRKFNRLNGIQGSKVHYIPRKRTRGGVAHDNKLIQKLFIDGAMEILGDEAWKYANKQGGKVRRLKQTFRVLKRDLGYKRLPYDTFYDWFRHFLQFGETPSDTRRRIRLTRGKRKQYTKATTFSPEEDRSLQEIFEESPHLYLDEIQTAMRRKFGKQWHTSTLWRRMVTLGYSLQKMVFRARQRSESDRRRFRRKLDVFLPDARMAIWVDETQKSNNAARRLRGWGKRSNPPVVDTFFQEDFRKRYTMIGASNYKGFVKSACKIIEREHDRNDRDPDRGTVDTERFEEYVEFSLVPELGSYPRREPNSVVFISHRRSKC
jgi:transposase